MPPEKDLFTGVKPDSIAERAAKEFAEQLANPCRRDAWTGSTLYYLGWAAQGHTVRRWDGRVWGPAFTVPAATIKKSVAVQMPTGASKPEEKS